MAGLNPHNINPKKTILFLGAGASVPSGAPTGEALSKLLIQQFGVATTESPSLSDTCSYIAETEGRRSLVLAIQKVLMGLEPDPGIKSIPYLDWPEIFTTNFDILVEKAYDAAKRPLGVVSSDYDITDDSQPNETKLYKIHGCAKADRSLNHRSSLVLTDEDYANFKEYRDRVFNKLEFSLYTMDVLVIGLSLADQHLKDLVRDVCTIKQRIGSTRRVIVNVYNADPVRVASVRQLGCDVISSSLTEILVEILNDKDEEVKSDLLDGTILPERLIPSTVIVDEVTRKEKNDPWRLYNGRPASYQDILDEFTFERSVESDAIARLLSSDLRYLIVSGTYGVGKTTLLRRLGLRASNKEPHFRFVWEHDANLALNVNSWIDTHRRLQEMDYTGMLIIDDAHEFGKEIRELVSRLPEDGDGGLKLLLGVNKNMWTPIIKSRAIFSVGRELNLSQLTEEEIRSLIRLIETNVNIRQLAEQDFVLLTTTQKVARLRNKCGRDMYVCLKNIFSNDGLDQIILYEYDKLSEQYQDIYRIVSALEAFGCHVHRQMVLRILKVPAVQVGQVLKELDGIIFEHDEASAPGEAGVFRWSTRHQIVAETITKFKFADVNRRFSLLSDVIRNLNPLVQIERRTLQSMCNSKRGIDGLSNIEDRVTFYRLLTEIAPFQRLPWHRLLSILIDEGRTEEAERAIQRTEDYFKNDATILRRRISLEIVKAEKGFDFSDQDREALLIGARNDAVDLARRKKTNKYVYSTLMDAELALARFTGNTEAAHQSAELLYNAYEELLDPWLVSKHREYNFQLRQLDVRLALRD